MQTAKRKQAGGGDWKKNNAFGIAAAVFLVVGVGFLWWWLAGSSGPAASAGKSAYKWQCESTEKVYPVTINQLNDYKTYMRYSESPADCEVCGKKDAYRVYYCPQCQKHYKYGPAEEGVEKLFCPKDHPIAPQDR